MTPRRDQSRGAGEKNTHHRTNGRIGKEKYAVPAIGTPGIALFLFFRKRIDLLMRKQNLEEAKDSSGRREVCLVAVTDKQMRRAVLRYTTSELSTYVLAGEGARNGQIFRKSNGRSNSFNPASGAEYLRCIPQLARTEPWRCDPYLLSHLAAEGSSNPLTLKAFGVLQRPLEAIGTSAISFDVEVELARCIE
ncbi:hypothetical protein C8R46DRAFT_1048204 [Mycena filopes]|nr:hypothetical protein C8R46DRAFT_1048204 [Mycena filopes]